MRHKLLILPAFLLLGLSIYTGMLLYANYTASSTRDDISNWQMNRIRPDEKSIQQSLENLQQALKLDPGNPEYLGKEAQLYRYKALSLRAESEQSNIANREALVRYQHLLTLRPSWAPYWASIVSIKYDLWEFDEVMINALHNAARLALWFKGNQHIILRAGFNGWPFLDNQTREVINKTLERAMQLQPRETIRLALEYGFSDRLTSYLELDEKLQKFYESESKAIQKRKE